MFHYPICKPMRAPKLTGLEDFIQRTLRPASPTHVTCLVVLWHGQISKLTYPNINVIGIPLLIELK